MINKVLNTDFFRESKRRLLNLKGIASGRYAYKGPDIVQIDLTDKCNSNCLLCWMHSPLSCEDKDYDELDFDKLKTFIKDIGNAGTKEIIFSGGGEPFCYPKIWEVLEFTQQEGLIFRINTNFTLLDQEAIRRLVTFDKLAALTISLWSGEASIYSKLHNRDQEIFYGVKKNIQFFNRLKRNSLKVKLHAVINKLNYGGLQKLIDLTVETQCDFIEFTVMDKSHVSETFLLNNERLAALKKELRIIPQYLNNKNTKVKLVNQRLFARRISSPRAFCGEYDTVVDRIPCYAGWTFLRLKANGDFNSCLKSHKTPIGNIYENNFSSVWNNPMQQEFRKKATGVPKEKEYFSLIGNSSGIEAGCRMVCDNILVNEHIYKILRYFFCNRNKQD